MEKQLKGKITGIFEKIELMNGVITQKMSFKPNEGEITYINLYGCTEKLSGFTTGDEVLVSVKEKVNGRYTNLYLSSIKSAKEIDMEQERINQLMIKKAKFEKQEKLIAEFEYMEGRIYRKLLVERPDLNNFSSTSIINCIRLGLYYINKLDGSKQKEAFINFYNKLKKYSCDEILASENKIKELFNVKENKVVNFNLILDNM